MNQKQVLASIVSKRSLKLYHWKGTEVKSVQSNPMYSFIFRSHDYKSLMREFFAYLILAIMK